MSQISSAHDILHNKPYLAWHTGDIDALSEKSVVEKVLNYGDWEDVKQLINVLGMEKTAELFVQTISADRDNYNPVIKHFFIKFFQRHAPECFK
jgi:hypothetical protein